MAIQHANGPETPAATATPAKRTRVPLVRMTDAAAERIRALVVLKPGALGLKVGVKKGGCAGLEYTMALAEAKDRFDEVIEDKGATLLIDGAALMYLIGTEVDFQTDKLSSQFVFKNPNQVSACGCGESVELKPAEKPAG
jgi:iron-sulfur cluster assembly protein